MSAACAAAAGDTSAGASVSSETPPMTLAAVDGEMVPPAVASCSWLAISCFVRIL
eukprot:CAMPEP_0174937456 /NCGR_PEP_ID=MMETSP1355-20121228/60536_1 /TAXON_ID=464990 /ORGANISM="Hemiselmis tepida, Strain CCMP443" /LENGTH=54 /DNA_ID=CAMNT_0016184307 /DNA_START=27 /DNA_END=191 /DNA_ORIENTATION=-